MVISTFFLVANLDQDDLICMHFSRFFLDFKEKSDFNNSWNPDIDCCDLVLISVCIARSRHLSLPIS